MYQVQSGARTKCSASASGIIPAPPQSRAGAVGTGSTRGGSPVSGDGSLRRRNATRPPNTASTAVTSVARYPLRVQVVQALTGSRPQLVDRAELDRLGRAGLGAGRFHPALEPVVAQRALLRDTFVGVHLDHAVRAGRDAVAAAVADVRLDEDGVELGLDDRPGRADLHAAGVLAVLADVGHHEPGFSLARARGLVRHVVDELHVPPVLGVQAPGVVEAVAEGRLVSRKLVPGLTRDLAGLAADADARVGEEPVGLARLDIRHQNPIQNPMRLGVILERPCSVA